ncbi:hypothetical protein BU15DRAFT_84129 [Melanogaster broomeanus]|nr:hypothetical protein BU15DRAFT_84129 [Melanogaster broomeanus]
MPKRARKVRSAIEHLGNWAKKKKTLGGGKENEALESSQDSPASSSHDVTTWPFEDISTHPQLYPTQAWTGNDQLGQLRNTVDTMSTSFIFIPIPSKNPHTASHSHPQNMLSYTPTTRPKYGRLMEKGTPSGRPTETVTSVKVAKPTVVRPRE